MSLFNRLFGSTEVISKEIESDDKQIALLWKDYLKNYSEKKELISKLDITNFASYLKRLNQLLKNELDDVNKSEKDESELIADLEKLTHSEKIKRVHKLEQCLCYAESKHEYVHKLLHYLYQILKKQHELIISFEKQKNSNETLKKLKEELLVEDEIITKIKDMSSFQKIFSTLAKGENIIKKMDSKEKKMINKMQEGMNKIFSNEIEKGITYEWAMTVYEAIEDKVHESVANGTLEYHNDVDYEFVNKNEFVTLSKETIQHLKRKQISEQMLNTFVHLFRDWYNHNRE